MKKIIAIILVIASAVGFCITGYAAGSEEFISEVALVYEDSVEDALEAIEGTDWKLFDEDLNPNADYSIQDGVYLVYKTSTNVEDSITDLRVMNMYGGYSLGDYETQLEKSREGYMKMVTYIRRAAAEFKAAYEAGDQMAALAYRQMNYYKDIGETGLLMGDFLLNIPSDEALVTVMMEGNMDVVANLIALLAIGVSGDGTDTFAKRVTAAYGKKDTFTHEEYYDIALVLTEEFAAIESDLRRYETLKSEYNLNDENMDEDEYQFLVNYAANAQALEQIQYGTTTLKDYILSGQWTATDLYPIAAALTEGQKALCEMRLFTLVLQFGGPSKEISKLVEQVEEVEKKLYDNNGILQPIDVYIGVDRSLFDGAYAFTTEAERQQAMTGATWTPGSQGVSDSVMIATLTIVSLGLVTALIPAISYGVGKIILTVNAKLASSIITATYLGETVTTPFKLKLVGFIYHYIAPYAGIFVVVALALLMIAVGTLGIASVYNYYNPDYTEIPNTMIDIRETDLGDKYIKYNAAKVFDGDGKNADFNAYEGKQWIALYYTKDATAGNCLTPNFVRRTNNNAVSRRHQGVCMFGETKPYNLNSHVFNADADGIYLTVRYSNTKKEAAEIPDVIGSIMMRGAYYALAAIVGAGAGVGTMALLQKKKKRNGEDAEI